MDYYANQQEMLGGQVCYLPNEQVCSIVTQKSIPPYLTGNKPALPVFHACAANTKKYSKVLKSGCSRIH